MKKQIMASVLVFVLMLSMCTAVFAEEQQDTQSYKDYVTFEFTVECKVVNENTFSPGENFYFTVPECIGVTDAKDGVTAENAPKFEHVYPAGGYGSSTGCKGTATFVMPRYDSVGVGVYTYKTNLEAKTTAGMTYDDEEYTFTVTVINGEDGKLIRIPSMLKNKNGVKIDSVVNTYSAGSLSVKKEVKGNMGDTSKEFTVTVTLKSSKPVNQNILYKVGTETRKIESGNTGWKDGVATAKFTLKDGETVTLENIPYDVTYTVEEDSYESDGYEAASYDENQSGTISSPSVSTTIVNTKNKEVDTGIRLDSVPYIMMLIAVCASMFVFAARKRMMRED